MVRRVRTPKEKAAILGIGVTAVMGSFLFKDHPAAGCILFAIGFVLCIYFSRLAKLHGDDRSFLREVRKVFRLRYATDKSNIIKTRGLSACLTDPFSMERLSDDKFPR